MYVSALPSGNSYGCRFLKTCPTRLQGRISRLPPHIHTRKESSGGEGGGQIRGHQWCCLICIAPKPQTTRAALPRQQMAASWKSAGLKLLLGSFHAPLPCNFEGQRRHFNARAAPTTSAEYMKHRLDYHYYYYFCVCHAANSRDGRKYSSKRSQFSPNIVLYVYVIHIQETFFL